MEKPNRIPPTDLQSSMHYSLMDNEPHDFPVPALEKVSGAYLKPSIPGRTSTDYGQKLDADLFDTAEPGMDLELPIDGNQSPGQSDSDFNPYDIEEEPMDSPLTESVLKKMSFIRKRPWAKRTFRSVGKGSIRGSVFTLFSGAVGAGVLSLPKVVSYFGVAMGCAVIILNAFLAYASYWALFQGIMASGKKRYANLISYYLGPNNAKLFAWFIFGVCFISANVYVCMAWNFIEYIVDEFDIYPLPKDANGNYMEYSPTMWIVRIICMSGLCLVVLPIALIKDQNSLRFMSIGNLLTLFYVIILGCIQTPEYINHYTENGNYEITYWSKMPCMDWMAGFATIILSYMCHPNFFYIRNELVKPNKPRVKKVLMYSIATETLIYLLMGAVGYLSLGDNNMVSLFTLRPKIGNGGDWPMKIAVLLFLVLSITNIGINLYPCREQLVSILGAGQKPKTRTACALGTLIACILITVVYPDIMGIFGLCGGLFCTYIGWVFPFLIMIRMMPEKKWFEYPKFFYYVGFFFIVWISVGSTLQSIFWWDFQAATSGNVLISTVMITVKQLLGI